MTVAAFGKYRVVRKIGEGGFGEVYEGLDPLLNRRVAIKTCSSTDAELRQRFAREAEIAANLRHPNIVTIFDFGHQEGTPYLVQEYLSGEDLDHKLKRGELLDEAQVRGYLLQVAAGLEFAHSREVVHRDVKPANIRILDDGQVRIMDFGIAKLLTAQTQLTRTGMALGTAAYLPPEQIMGKQVDQRADLFSFGVMAYEMITGERPFSGDSMSTILYAIAHKEPAPVAALCSRCPPRLATLIETCLAKDPDGRHPGFAEVIAELEELAATTTVLPAGPPPPPVPAPSTHAGMGTRSVQGPESARTEQTVLSQPVSGTTTQKPPNRGARKVLIALLAAGLLLALGLGLATLTKRRGKVASTTAERAEPALAEATQAPTAGDLADADAIVGDEAAAEDADLAEAGPGEAPLEAAESATAAPEARSTAEPQTRAAPPPPQRRTEPAPTKPKQETKPELESFTEPAATASASDAPEPEASPETAAEPLIANAPFGLELGRLAPGQQVYADREFTYQDVPNAYRDLTCVRTLNDFKRIATSIELEISRAAQVFVAHDRRIRRKPKWLGAFSRTGETLTIREGARDQDVSVYDVFVRDYAPGTVTLGPNTPPKAKKRVSMYAVFVRERD